MHLSDSPEAIKTLLQEKFAELLQQAFEKLDSTASTRTIELTVWGLLLALGNVLLAAMLARRCEQAMMVELAGKGLKRHQVRVLSSANHRATLTTTLGRVHFPVYAYRECTDDVQRHAVIRTPSRRDVLPLLPRCRSSELCLEWETRLGADHPYRLAQQELTFFTHGAVTLEDNTIAAHLVHASAAVDRAWLYRKPDEIVAILRERAMVDLHSGKPVIYASSDAHALRRYTDDTTTAAWKMANGIRLWCVDKDTGQIIHLGGEFTWGDCKHVTTIFKDLIALGILPADGDYAGGVTAQLCWLSDGMPWFETHLVPLFSKDMVVELDVYHLLERAAELARALYKKPKDQARWYRQFEAVVTNRDPALAQQTKQPKKRRGPRTSNRKPFAQQITEAAVRAASTANGAPTADVICELLPSQAASVKGQAALDEFIGYLAANAHRIDYLGYRARGLQIGSGAMESMHRTGSQVRLKRPGAKWLAEHAQAVFQWRMLKLVGRWDEFWGQANLSQQLMAHWQLKSVEYSLNEAA